MVDGYCDPAFGNVREVFAASLAAGDDLGGAVAVSVGARQVVDLWGGLADARNGQAWQRDTQCVTFSCTKAVTATAAMLLAERGAVSFADPVTRWWPEFGAHGKQEASGEHLLTHQVGLPAFDRPVSVEQSADPGAMADQLAAQAPEWPPGATHGYHAITFGWLVGELVRRHAGMPVGDFVRTELGADLALGVEPASLPSIARISAGRPMRVDEPAADPDATRRLVAAVQDRTSRYSRSTGNPAASFNNPILLRAGWPAAGLVCTARALAGFYGELVAGSLLAHSTLDDALRERVRGPDATMVTESAFGLGFMLPSANLFLPPAARSTAFGHPGASGALGLGDVERGVALAYVCNLARPALGDRRAYRLVDAVYEAL